MASVGAFNEIMTQFLSELTQTFPEEPTIKKYKNGFELMKDGNPRKIMEEFMSTVRPYGDYIMAKDEKFFLEADVSVIQELNLKAYWTPDLSPNTKDAIWQYLQSLFTVGNALVSIPAETMGQIETLAAQMAETMENDPNALGSLMSGLGGLFGGLGAKK